MPYRLNNFTGKLIQCKQFDKYTKNCYRTVDRSMRKIKNKNLIKERCYRREKKQGEKREEKQIERESVRKEEAKRDNSEGVRREKK